MKRKWKEQRKQAGGQGALLPSDWEYIISFILKNDRSCKKVWRDPIRELPRCSGNMGWEDGSQVLLESVKQYYSSKTLQPATVRHPPVNTMVMQYHIGRSACLL